MTDARTDTEQARQDFMELVADYQERHDVGFTEAMQACIRLYPKMYWRWQGANAVTDRYAGLSPAGREFMHIVERRLAHDPDLSAVDAVRQIIEQKPHLYRKMRAGQ